MYQRLYSSRLKTILARTLDVLTVAALGAAAWLFFVQTRRSEPSGVSTPSLAALSFPVDSVLEGFVVVDSFGETRTLFGARDSLPRLVFIFESDCSACGVQKRTWLELADRALTLSIKTVGLTPEPPSEPVWSYFSGSTVEVLRMEDPTVLMTRFGTRLVPTTALIGRHGQVVERHVGLLDPESTHTIAELFEKLE